MNCPICKSELKQEYAHCGNYGTEESFYHCINCKLYSEQFLYGSTEICVGDFMTGYSYTIDCDDLKELRKKIDQVAKLYSKEDAI